MSRHRFYQGKRTTSSSSPSRCVTLILPPAGSQSVIPPSSVGISRLGIKVINRALRRARWLGLLMMHIPALGSPWKPGVHSSVEIYIQENNALL